MSNVLKHIQHYIKFQIIQMDYIIPIIQLYMHYLNSMKTPLKKKSNLLKMLKQLMIIHEKFFVQLVLSLKKVFNVYNVNVYFVRQVYLFLFLFYFYLMVIHYQMVIYIQYLLFLKILSVSLAQQYVFGLSFQVNLLNGMH